ncbi:YdeI/OmpD-associated family protein [Marivita sp. S6314]|uniref:YdeI/OmpD-associated family protein n=1 Tax=Marivita sp. S6314 TaxID=2926406 RepID=UPI001FF22439|nr:YdeI/OmpD-associated family protein [Marivita sp. S6314]MCK0148979.1 YdeI/OmpD-associated family protein [Marivita sp. S6314]
MKRPPHPMPDFVRDALEDHGLAAQYDARPWYQRNDYLGWIMRAKRADTRQKRLAQMLDELRAGDVYMKMAWRPRRGGHQDDGSGDC